MPPSGTFVLVRLVPITPASPGFEALKAESLAEGLNMLARFQANWASGTNRFDRPGEIILGAFTEGRLVAMGGLNVDPFDPRPGTGRVRHLYVSPSRRRQGMGVTLAKSIIGAAHGHFDLLNTNAPPAAHAFYESLGFRSVDGLAGVTHRLVLT